MAQISHPWMRPAAVGLLAIVLIASLSGCPCDVLPEFGAYSYVAQAYHGYLVPTKADGIYELNLSNVLPELTWCTGQPVVAAGTMAWPLFVRTVWPAFLDEKRPRGAVACRLEDGVWVLLPARFHGVAMAKGAREIVWSVELPAPPPRSVLTGVTVFIDAEGDTSSAPQDTGVFVCGPAQAQFQATGTANRYQAVLSDPPADILMIAARPDLAAAPQSLDYFVTNLWAQAYSYWPPLGAFSVETADGGQHTLIAALSEPEWDAGAGILTFSADVLSGDPQGLAGPATLVIDDGTWVFEGSEFGDWDPDGVYMVVYIDQDGERTYSMGPKGTPLNGWSRTGFFGTYDDCFAEMKRLRHQDCVDSGCGNCSDWGACLDDLK